jgi:hypothetical protein
MTFAEAIVQMLKEPWEVFANNNHDDDVQCVFRAREDGGGMYFQMLDLDDPAQSGWVNAAFTAADVSSDWARVIPPKKETK